MFPGTIIGIDYGDVTEEDSDDDGEQDPPIWSNRIYIGDLSEISLGIHDEVRKRQTCRLLC